MAEQLREQIAIDLYGFLSHPTLTKELIKANWEFLRQDDKQYYRNIARFIASHQPVNQPDISEQERKIKHTADYFQVPYETARKILNGEALEGLGKVSITKGTDRTSTSLSDQQAMEAVAKLIIDARVSHVEGGIGWTENVYDLDAEEVAESILSTLAGLGYVQISGITDRLKVLERSYKLDAQLAQNKDEATYKTGIVKGIQLVQDMLSQGWRKVK